MNKQILYVMGSHWKFVSGDWLCLLDIFKNGVLPCGEWIPGGEEQHKESGRRSLQPLANKMVAWTEVGEGEKNVYAVGSAC
jgi:hypothetical protein